MTWNDFIRWLSLGNQLHGVRLVDEGLRGRFKAAYPDVEVQPASPPRTVAAVDADSTGAQVKSPPVSMDTEQPASQYGESTAQASTYASSDEKTMMAEVETAA